MVLPEVMGELPRVVSALGLGAAGFIFGKSLTRGQVPLIERVARVGVPDLPPRLRLYTRSLTAIWTAWFVAVAVSAATGWLSAMVASLTAWIGTFVLFVGEHLLRRFVLFPSEQFPGLLQQVRDTVHVWRPRGRR